MTGLLDLSEGLAWFALFPAIHFLSQLLLLSGSQGCQGVSPCCLGAKLGWAPHQWPVRCKATKSDKQPFTLKLLQTVRSVFELRDLRTWRKPLAHIKRPWEGIKPQNLLALSANHCSVGLKSYTSCVENWWQNYRNTKRFWKDTSARGTNGLV